MSTEKVKLRSVKVEYVKGKYAFKQRMNILGDKPGIYNIEFSGPISVFQRDPDSILTMYEVERNRGRLDKGSRDALKGLQMNLNNTKVIESKGVTHVIVYECLNK